jgi:hypothetical protein
MINPELRRNLWLEFSLHRVIAVPVVIVLAVMLIAAMGKKDALESIASFAGMGYAAMVLLWGTQRAAASVMEEAQERTWDVQRMSAIGPWAMTWGKLFGAPSFAWYGGVILLAVYVVAGWTTLKIPLIKFAMAMVIFAVMLHAIALTGSVIAARKGVARRGIGLLVLVLVVFALILPGWRLAEQFGESMRWWRVNFSTADFILASLCAYAGWAVLGAYRAMCNELEIRTLPWALPAFIVFSAVYCAGFAVNTHRGGDIGAVLLAGVFLSMAFTYLMLFGEPSGAAVWQRLRTRVRAAQWKRALQELPIWMLALTIGLMFAVAAILAPFTSGHTGALREIGLAPLALMLFGLRDAAILQFFALARRPRRVEAATLFYLMLLYLLVPGLLSGMNLDTAASIVRPNIVERPVFATAVLAAQSAIAIALAWWRWRSIHAPDTDAPTRK